MRLLAGLTAVLLLTATPALTQENLVRYAATEGEYSILMPEPPTVTTIWAGNPIAAAYNIVAPADATALGETAIYRRVDSDTGDAFSVTMTTLKATKTSLEALSKEQIAEVLNTAAAPFSLEKTQESASSGSQSLKWSTLTGYQLGQDQQLTFHALHYLAGLDSVTVVHLSFSLENRRFKNEYEVMGRSIKYTGH